MAMCWADNPEVLGLDSPAWTLEISEILYVVFSAYLTVWTISTAWLKVQGSCVSVLYTEHNKEPGRLFEVRARRIERRTCLYLICLSPL